MTRTTSDILTVSGLNDIVAVGHHHNEKWVGEDPNKAYSGDFAMLTRATERF